MGRDRNGQYTCGICGLAVARQNGKNGAIEIRELFGMVELGEKFLHTAHEVKTARKAFKRLKHFFGERAEDPSANFPELNALVVEVRNTNGQEAIVLRNGGSVEFVARSRGSGRGFTVDVLVLDEAQDLTDDELEALRPAISAAPLGNPQVIYTGTPPNPEKGQTGAVFTRIRNRAIGGAKRMCFTDFGVDDGPIPDVNDRNLWRQTNPGLSRGRLLLSTIEDERNDLSEEGFARERLGWWGDPHKEHSNIFDLDAWRACRTDEQPPEPAAIAVAVSIDQAWSSIAAAGELDGKPYLGASHRRRGTAWVVAEAARIHAERDVPVVVDAKGPAAYLIPKLEELGVEVLRASTEDYVTTCASLLELVSTREMFHGGHDDLDEAVVLARKRAVGDRFAWARKSGDISMLEAATLALFGLLHDEDDESIYEGRGMVLL